MKQRFLIVGLVLGLMLASLGLVHAGSSNPTAFGVDWSPDTQWIAVNTTQGLYLYDARNPDAEASIYFEGETVSTMEFNRSSSRLAVALSRNEESPVQIISLETGEIVQSLLPEKSPEDSVNVIYDMLYSRDGAYLLVANNGILNFFDAETGEIRKVIQMNLSGTYSYSHWITSVSEIGDGHFAVTNWQGTLSIVNVENWIEDSYSLESLFLYSAEYLEGSQYLVFASEGIFTFDTEDESLELLVRPSEEEFTAGYALAPEMQSFVVGTLGFWQAYDMSSQEISLEIQLEESTSRIFAFDYRADGRRFVSLQTDGELIIWDAETGAIIRSLAKFERAFGYKWG